jgi:hypothetical protein
MSDVNSSVKKLRKLMREGFPENTPAHVKEISSNNDRLVAILGGTMIELALTDVLRSVMFRGDNKLFDPHQPLSTLSSKIQLAFSLGLIDDDIHRNCEYIREVRNVFSHRLAPTSFRTPEVSAVCKLLKMGEIEGKKNNKRNMRARYMQAAMRCGRQIAMRATSGRKNVIDGLKRGETPFPPASLP